MVQNEQQRRMFAEGRDLMLEWRRLFPETGGIPTQRERQVLSRQLDLNLPYINRCLTIFLE